MYILNDICFLCFVNHSNIKSIYLLDDDGLIVKDKLQYVLSEIVNFEPEEPKKICTDCLKDLDQVYKFKQKCTKNILDLRDYFERHTEIKNDYTVFATTLTKDETITDHELDIKEESLDPYSSCKIENNVQETNNVKVEGNIDESFEETQREKFQEVIIKREPGEINQENDIKSDPLSIEEMQTNYEQATDTADDMMSDSEFDSTPPEVSTNPKKAEHSLMPIKSSNLYESVYKKFIIWCTEKQISIYSEEVMLIYFSELANKMKMKGPTLWSQYSMIKSKLKDKSGVDISQYGKLRAYLKKMNEGYTPKKSKTFTKEQFERFLNEAPNEHYLGIKVVLIIGISGSCRCDEMLKMTVDHIQDFGSMLHIKIPGTCSTKIRSFTIVGDKYLNLYRKYSSLRPSNMEDRRFFLKYADGKCHRMAMGIHSIGKVPKQVATFLNLPNANEYTGHGLRRTSAALLL